MDWGFLLETFTRGIMVRAGRKTRDLGDRPIARSVNVPTTNITLFIRRLYLHEARYDKIPVQFFVVRVLPHDLCTIPFPRSYLDFRPWMQNPSEREDGMVLSPC